MEGSTQVLMMMMMMIAHPHLSLLSFFLQELHVLSASNSRELSCLKEKKEAWLCVLYIVSHLSISFAFSTDVQDFLELSYHICNIFRK